MEKHMLASKVLLAVNACKVLDTLAAPMKKLELLHFYEECDLQKHAAALKGAAGDGPTSLRLKTSTTRHWDMSWMTPLN